MGDADVSILAGTGKPVISYDFNFVRGWRGPAFYSNGGLNPIMDLSHLKTCFLAGTLGQGGAERQLFFILRALRQCGAVPRLLCLAQDEFWEEPIRKLGVPITFVGQAKSKLMRLFRIMMELRRHPPQILQSQHFYTSAYVGAAARMLGLCGIGAMRCDGLTEVLDTGLIGGRLSLRAPKVIAANSRVAIRYATDHGVPPGRLYFLRNVVDTEYWNASPRHAVNRVHLITVGRLVQQKRLDRFLSVLARLRKATNREVKGTIVGSGPLRESLERQARELGLWPSSVEFRGAIADMAQIYQQADICVLTSDYEGTPNVLLEAMASSLPVVATRVGGVPDIVRHGENGFMVLPGDEDSLCASLVRLINDSQRRLQMGKNARAYIEANHSVDAMRALLAGLYQLALS
jgi:glycosyltransferase involved in cell wall biosynthesis